MFKCCNGDSPVVKRNLHVTILGAVVVIALILSITLLATLLPKHELPPGAVDRIECPGFNTKTECESHKCFYEPAKIGPACYMRKNDFGYTVESVTKNPNGMTANLKMISEETPYGPSFQNAFVEVTYISSSIVRFKITHGNKRKKRYEVPAQDIFPLLVNQTLAEASDINYKIEISKKSQIFALTLKRKIGVKLFDTSIGGLVLSDQYLQIASYLPSNRIYGLGEHVHEHFRHDMNFRSWPMFSRDQPPDENSGNLYGVHPFYTCLEKNGQSHGVLFLNSNAMEVTLLPAPAVSFRTIGGVLDFFVFIGQDPEEVIQLYTSLVGRPMMPPYWALGFQLSRYGYRTLDDVKDVIERTRNADIAQDVQYLDIDHMDDAKDFTWDKDAYEGLPAYIRKTKEEYGLRWIIILDPAIAAGYPTYKKGSSSKVFIRADPNWNKEIFPVNVRQSGFVFGKVWPEGIVAFPDFLRDNTKDWWKNEIASFYQSVEFDGLWIDMNEPANFGTNEETPFYCEFLEPDEKCWSLMCPESQYDDPPYNPLRRTGSPRLSQKTICMSSLHGNASFPYLHYDVHSLYGWSQTKATLEAAQQATQGRSVVISRSTYPSSGQHAGHWLGDNKSSWKDMRKSIIGMLEFNLFGIPYIGADVCGFFGDSTPQLCERWMQLGAFYPFFRNHNGMDQKDQDPVALGKDATEGSKRAVKRRYALIPYLYTLFYRAHVDGSTVVRPLFHEFPADIVVDIDTQFMWGKSLLISPVLDEDEKSISVYLPNDEWWHFNYEKSSMERLKGQYVIKTNLEYNIPLHVRGGTILPTEEYSLRNSTAMADYKYLNLFVFPKKGQSSGELFYDDGESINTVEDGAYTLFTFEQSDCTLSISKEEYVNYTAPVPILNEVYVFKVNSADDAMADDTALTQSLNDKLKVLTLTVGSDMSQISTITWGTSDSCNMAT